MSESMLPVQPTGQNCDIMLIGRCAVKKEQQRLRSSEYVTRMEHIISGKWQYSAVTLYTKQTAIKNQPRRSETRKNRRNAS